MRAGKCKSRTVERKAERWAETLLRVVCPSSGAVQVTYLKRQMGTLLFPADMHWLRVVPMGETCLVLRPLH